MMNNLFSVFDPCTGSLSLNWLSTLIFMIILPFKFWFMPNKILIMFNKLLVTLKIEMQNLMPYKGSTLMFLTILMFILTNNVMGLIPYVFTSSSHLVFSLSMALPLWMSFMLYGWINKYNEMFSHLLPVGTPPLLMPFMVMIETISNVIRPGALSVRLTANMIAGHLLMPLLGNNTNSLMLMVSTMIIYVILFMFEAAVAMIQSYVFMTLTTLYSSEV